MRPCVTVGIAGGTASGKSWLAHFLARELAGQAAVISQDWYYQDHAGVDDAHAAELNFDHPDAFDMPLLIAHLDALREGGYVETPRYDYCTHARVPGPWLAPAPVLVLEGILVLHHPAVRRRLKHAVFVETPADVRLARRLERDRVERALPPAESRRLYETFARPMHDAFVQPSAGWAHDLWRSLDDPQYPQQLAAKIKKYGVMKTDTFIDMATDKELVDYWSMAGTPRGHFLLTARWWIKCFAWRFVVAGSRTVKRLLDIAVALCALVTLSPLLLTVMAIIKVEDGGPIFFSQQRVGYRGRTFPMWKFRSMVPNADALKDKLLTNNEMQGGVIFKIKNDPRVTRIGKWIRKFSVDEMPQLWNVLDGTMSVVGPRPPVPREVAQYSPEDRQRLLAKPGLTCFWQVGGRSNIDFEGQVRLDLQYIRSRSFLLDLKLLFKTVPAVLMGDGAY